MTRAQKLYYLLVGFFAFAAFGVGFGLNDIKTSLAQTGCTLSVDDDWCSEWTIAKWLTIRENPNGGISTIGSVGPSDWTVNGKARVNGATTNFTETWRLAQIFRVYKPTAHNSELYTRVATRQPNEDVYSGGFGVGRIADATIDYVTNGYTGEGGGDARWNPGYYTQTYWGIDGEPGNSRIRLYYPKKWTITGRFD